MIKIYNSDLDSFQNIFTKIVEEFDYNEIIKDFSLYSDGDYDNAMFISGGATRFVGLAGAAIEVFKAGYKPDVIGGISSGALLALPLILGKNNEIISAGKTILRENIFDISPTNDKGNLTFLAVCRAIFGKYSFGVQNIPKILKKYVSCQEFGYYQGNKSCPDVLIMAVNANTGNPKIWNIKDPNISYEKYIDIVSASCAIPIMTQAIWIDGEPYFDGGMRNHIPSAPILAKCDIKKSLSIYSRPQEFEEFDDEWQNNIVKMIWRTLRVMTMAISKADERNENLLCLLKNIKKCQIFIPNILKHLYDTNDLDILLEKSREEAIKQLQTFI